MPDTPQDNEQPKIIVDDDWKSQAKAEKERLAKEVESERPGEGGPGGEQRLPEANFLNLVNALASQVAMALGGMVDPNSGRRIVDMDLAKFYIDCLGVLEEKTSGQISDEEKQHLETTTYELRMTFVSIAQQIAAQGAQRGQAAPGAAPDVNPDLPQ